MPIKCPLAIIAFYIRNCKVCLYYTMEHQLNFYQQGVHDYSQTVITLSVQTVRVVRMDSPYFPYGLSILSVRTVCFVCWWSITAKTVIKRL